MTVTIDEFIERSNKKHNNFYDYSKFVYITYTESSFIICPLHGPYKQTPKKHLTGQGCTDCGKLRSAKMKKEKYKKYFIQRAEDKHGKKYDYNESIIIGSKFDFTFKCPDHGYKTQKAAKHLAGDGCKECGIMKRAYTQSLKARTQFIEKANKKHNGKYDYSKTVYGKNANEKVTVGCRHHGDFHITPSHHLDGKGCKPCGIESNTENQRLSHSDIINESKTLFPDLYGYDKSYYIDCTTPVTFYCNIHSVYFDQIAYNHLKGHKGCKQCYCNRITENYLCEQLHLMLAAYDIKIFQNYRPSFLNRMEYDFYLESPNDNIAIEYDGEQHFYPVRFGGIDNTLAESNFQSQVIRDKLKDELSIENNIKLIRIPYYEFNTDNNKESTITKLIKDILDHFNYQGTLKDIEEDIDLY